MNNFLLKYKKSGYNIEKKLKWTKFSTLMSCWFCRLVISFSVVDGSKFVFIYENFPRSTRNFNSFISLEYVRHESEKKHWQNEATSHAEKLLFSIINCSNIPSDRPPHSEKWRISNNTKNLRDILGIYKNFLILLIFLSLSLSVLQIYPGHSQWCRCR